METLPAQGVLTRTRAHRKALGSTLLTAACALGVTVAMAAPATAAPATAAPAAAKPAAAPSASKLNASQFRGVNWADPNDNYANGPVVPTGLSTADNYRTTYLKTERIVDGFRSKVGANTIRLPVNPYSVNTAWWNSYKATVDAATHAGFKIILSYWEGTNAEKDGAVDSLPAWWSMWGTLTNTYKNNPQVFFEPMNEPFGYTAAQWEALVTTWVDLYTADGIPRNRIFVSGTGYNDHVNTVCSDAALQGTYVSQHFYGYWATGDYTDWISNLTSRLGDQACSSRTVLDEFGSPMTNGFNYRASATASDANTNNYVAYLQATTDTIRARHMGAVYWPGLRAGDSYSLTTLVGWGTHLRLIVNDRTGLSLIHWAWGLGHKSPHPKY